MLSRPVHSREGASAGLYSLLIHEDRAKEILWVSMIPTTNFFAPANQKHLGIDNGRENCDRATVLSNLMLILQSRKSNAFSASATANVSSTLIWSFFGTCKGH